MVKLTRSTTPIPIYEGAGLRKRCSSETASSSDEEEEVYIMEHSVAQGLVAKTQKRVQAFLDNSKWIRGNNHLSEITRFDEDDFELGQLVAFGGFSNIHSIASFHKDCDLKREQEADPQKQFVVKHLKSKLATNPHKFKSGARDICNETYLLSALNHKNIIQMRGISSCGIHGIVDTGRADSFFMIMEKLDHTLLHKIACWRQRGVREQSLNLKNLHKCQKTLDLFQERAAIVRDVASAIAYCHSHGIMHRDLKPGNIGVTADGTTVLFDFGLAIELPADSMTDPNATFQNLGNAGTTRYLAPEVIRKQPYNFKTETYSLSIVLWEVMSLSKPFECLSVAEVKESVARIGFRPSISGSWPRQLKHLLKKGWAKKASHRPSMKEMEAALNKLCQGGAPKQSALESILAAM